MIENLLRKYRITLFLFVVLVACGTQNKISRQYVNKPVTDLKEAFGELKAVIESADGQIYIYEKETELRSTEISQGKSTRDPIITPKAIKITRYYFVVKNDTVVSSKFEEEYKKVTSNK